jgi:putative colanic acid biosynthesis UDP-glucose lipid carrier transferase
MNREFVKSLQVLFVFLDLLMLNLAMLAGYLFNSQLFLTADYPISLPVLLVNCCWILPSLLFALYAGSSILKFELYAKKTAQTYVLLALFLLIYLLFSPFAISFRILVLEVLFLFLFGLAMVRFLYFWLKKQLVKQEDLINRVVILGYNDTAKKLAGYLEEDGINTELVGFFANPNQIQELTHYPILSDVSNAVQTASALNIQEIFSTISPEEDASIYLLMHESEKKCIRFKVVPSLSSFFSRPFHMDYINDLPILSPHADPLDDLGNKIKKRVFDVVVSSVVIIFILSWLVPILSLLIVLESKGPVFFMQMRTGMNDKPFRCFKFRSMRTTPQSEHVQATRKDARVTRIGAFLRKTSLDEFPQFFNVFNGDMSIVGPRPHMLQHTHEFAQLVDHYMIRQLLKPGITGWAQVNGFRGEITHPDQLRMRVSNDLWYLENWSIWLDLRIVFLTAYGVIKGDKNAY